jgi:hypothetical protein
VWRRKKKKEQRERPRWKEEGGVEKGEEGG